MSTKNWRSILNKYSLVLILLALMAVCGVANENFLKISNLLNVIKQQSVIIIISFGAMLLIICGLLDLAAGSVLALSGVICVSFFQHVPNVFLTILVAIVVAVACNLISALMVTFFQSEVSLYSHPLFQHQRFYLIYLRGNLSSLRCLYNGRCNENQCSLCYRLLR